jgi:ubiquinone/menaquinone biosynthesis C-methylase UbiE
MSFLCSRGGSGALLPQLLLAMGLLAPPALAGWEVKREPNTPAAGERLAISQDGVVRATFIFGEGQLKPYLNLFSADGLCLSEWSADQQFPHHRGFYIGWNQIKSDLGRHDLWHLNKGGRMEVRSIDVSQGHADHAAIQATVEWRAGSKDASGEDLLLVETRALKIATDAQGRLVVDANFALNARRGLTLAGDLQHSGVHFRGSHKLGSEQERTSYVWEPAAPGPGGKVVSRDLKWCRLLMPLGGQWHAVTLLNAPGNPVEELSWRAYGRFGFFFQKPLEPGETLALRYRLLAESAPAPGAKRHDEQELGGQRAAAAAEYGQFVQELHVAKSAPKPPGHPGYQTGGRLDPNGINKVYMGHQIAHVMGHQAADWLERPEREQEEQTDQMIELLDLKPGQVVADIGAGTGYISRRLAAKVGPAGKVLAVDIQPEMLDLLVETSRKAGFANIEPVLGGIEDPKLPERSVDLIIMVDVYHEFSHPHEMTRGMVRALKPGGRLVFVEYKAEDDSVPIKRVHKMSVEQIRKEAEVFPLKLSAAHAKLNWQHVVIFEENGLRE